MEGAVRFSVFHNLLLVCVNVWVTLALPSLVSHLTMFQLCVYMFILFWLLLLWVFARWHLNGGTFKDGWSCVLRYCVCFEMTLSTLVERPLVSVRTFVFFFVFSLCRSDVISLAFAVQEIFWVAFLQQQVTCCTFFVCVNIIHVSNYSRTPCL